MSWYREQLTAWLNQLDVKAGLVLDIGGAQGPVKGRTQSWDVKEYKIFDLPDYNVDEVGGGQKYRGYEQADVIFCLEVLEYCIKPFIVLTNVCNNLKKGGKAYITFAFVYPVHQEIELDSLRYTETGVKRLAEAVGLKISDIWYRHDRSGLLQQFYISDQMHAAKGYDHSIDGYIVEFTK